MTTVTTANLILRKYLESDQLSYSLLRSNPDVWRYSTRETDADETHAAAELKKICLAYTPQVSAPFALFLRNGDYIGEAGIYSRSDSCSRVNIGYNLLPGYWHKGYATEITRAIIENLFDSGAVHRIEATVVSENSASRRVLEKSGMQFEGLLRDFTVINGRRVSVCYYSILRSEYVSEQ